MYKKNKLTNSIGQVFKIKLCSHRYTLTKIRWESNLIKSLGKLDKKNNETNVYPHNLHAKIDK